MQKDSSKKQNSYLKTLIAFTILLSTSISNAQNVSETRWFFGNSIYNLVFDRNGREVYLDSVQSPIYRGRAGGITITDQFTGNLLFYSDGSEVFDATHLPTLDGSVLDARVTYNNPVVTAPVPGSQGQYYLFTNNGTQISYSIVDANQPGNGTTQFPKGIVTFANRTLLDIESSEGMSIIPVGDGREFWLISQDRNTFEFYVSSVNGLGVNFSYDLTDDDRPGFEASHFAYNQDSALLAVAPKTANRNIWILEFDIEQGDLDFLRSIPNTGFDDGAGESIYDVEWSADGSKLYFSRYGGNEMENRGQLYQFDFNDTTESVNPVLEADLFRSLGLQRAVDNRIYHLYQESMNGPIFLGRINQPDSLIDSVAYQPQVFNVDFNGTQFPSFADGYDFEFDLLDFTYIDSCLTNTTKFFPIVDPAPHRLIWELEPGVFSNAILPNYQYQQVFNGLVTLTAEINGISKTTSQFVEIVENDLMVDLGNDTTICVNEVLPLDAGEGASFVWNTGETTQTIEVDTAGTYWVEVTSASGCTDFDDIEVTEYGIQSQRSNQWYFGEQAGIEFTNGPIAILDGNRQMAEEGCATVSDVNGDLLFYTNGYTIWNRDHEVMMNGDSIGGDRNSAQNSLIMPFAGDNTMFYVFTTDEVYGTGEYALRYTIVDMKKDEARGAVVSTERIGGTFDVKNLKLMDHATERLTGSGFTGSDLIVTHEFGNNTFRTYRTGATGLTGPIYTPIGSVHAFETELNATGYMKISPTNNQIAVNLPGTGDVEILDFEMGVVDRPRLINTEENGLYGLEFSGSGSKLYVSTPEKLIQYDLDSLNSEDPVRDIAATKFDEYTGGTDYGALQIGPNGIIYLAVDNSSTIGTINSPDGDDDEASFNPSGFDLQGRVSRLGLPNFTQNQSTPLMEPSITVSDGCIGQVSVFSGAGRDGSIENYTWIFGDGQSSTDQNTTHTYSQVGTYEVQLILSNRCDEDTVLRQTIAINSLPASPSVPSDTSICDQEILLEAWPVDTAAFTYYWSTGDTTREVRISEPAIVDVAIINRETGCASDTLSVFISDSRPSADLGPDQAYCQNDPGQTLDAEITVGTVEWYIDGILQDTSRTFQVSTIIAGEFEYSVQITNTFGCIRRDTVQVLVRPSPDISALGNATTGCGNNDGSIDVTFNTSGSFLYRIDGPVSRGLFNSDGPAVRSIPASGSGDLPPGNYTLTVTNLVTNCTTSEVVQISDPGTFNFTAFANGSCEGEVELTLSNVPTSFFYEITDAAGMDIPGSPGTNQTVFANLSPGTYSIAVRDNAPPNCVETTTISIEPGAEPIFTFDAIQDFCGTSGVLRVIDGSGASYQWLDQSGALIGDTTILEITQSGIYTVVASGPGLCDRSEVIQAILNGDPSVSIDVLGDPCEGQQTLVANGSNGSGNYFFEWSTGSQSSQITIMDSGGYSVTMTDQTTGCTVSDAVDIVIQDEFNLSTAVNPDCENNGQVLISAIPNYSNEGITYTWEFEGNALPFTDSLITVSQSGQYQVTATNESGFCMASEVVDATVVPILEEDILLEETETFCRNDPANPMAELDPGIFNTYEWRIAGEEEIISTDPIFTTDQPGTYEVTLFNGFTCITELVTLIEDCRPTIHAPNAFSPNNNGVNETFFVFPEDTIDEFEILIYNRWGELVYRAETIDFRWDGIYKGSLLPPGTYGYIMKFSSSIAPDLGTIEQYGSVTLVR